MGFPYAPCAHGWMACLNDTSRLASIHDGRTTDLVSESNQGRSPHSSEEDGCPLICKLQCIKSWPAHHTCRHGLFLSATDVLPSGDMQVCADNFIIYKNQDHNEIRAVIPRRNDLAGDRSVLIVSYATHKKKAYSFFLVQVRPLLLEVRKVGT